MAIGASALLLWGFSAETWHIIGWRTSGVHSGQHFGLSMVWLSDVNHFSRAR